jgi:hypothetical protein
MDNVRKSTVVALFALRVKPAPTKRARRICATRKNAKLVEPVWAESVQITHVTALSVQQTSGVKSSMARLNVSPIGIDL